MEGEHLHALCLVGGGGGQFTARPPALGGDQNTMLTPRQYNLAHFGSTIVHTPSSSGSHSFQ